MRIKALTIRILKQLSHDKRTIALVLLAPILVMTLLYFVLSADNSVYDIAVIHAPDSFVTELSENEDYEINITKLTPKEAASALDNEEILAAVDMKDDYSDITLYLDGTSASDSKKVQAIVQGTVMAGFQKDMQSKIGPLSVSQPEVSTEYVYGSENSTAFDDFCAPLIGIIVFFFVFLIAGINFLEERTTGTLERLLSTPIRRHEIIAGYVLGFSLLAVIQTLIITFFVIYVLGMHTVGSIWLILLINLLTATAALTLGILLSTLANNAFQMIQFIPLVILPQVFLCGLFKLSDGWSTVGKILPLTYTTDALTEVAFRGQGFADIGTDLLALAGFICLFMVLNTLLIRKLRKV